MSKHIERGDTVQLLCGGPVMVVKKVADSPMIGEMAECLWFDTEGKVREGCFGTDLICYASAPLDPNHLPIQRPRV